MSSSRNEVAAVKNYIYQHYEEDLNLEMLAEKVYLSSGYLSFIFKKETGMSFVEYLTDTRMKEAMRLLKETNEKIYVVTQKVGYLESGYFSHVFKKKYGMSPIQCRRQGQ